MISESRRPTHSPTKKVFSEQEQWILDLRKNRNSGARCIQNELRRIHGFNLSLATIHKVLTKHRVKPLVRLRREIHQKRYSRPIPGDRVQMDTCKIAPGLYQYTAIDDCTRYQVLALFARRNAESTLEFFEKAIDVYSSDFGQSFLLIPDIRSGRNRTLESERSDADFFRYFTG